MLQIGQKYRCLMKSGETCPRSAGWGTEHPGVGSCKYHPGGRQGAPAGNKNALKHGLHEYLYFDAMTEEELELLRSKGGNKREALSGVYSALDLLDIRERRILARIKNLRNEDFVVTKRVKPKGCRNNSAVDVETETSEAASEHIVALDNALSVIGRHKAQLLALLEKMKVPTENKHAMALIEALDWSIEKISAGGPAPFMRS